MKPHANIMHKQDEVTGFLSTLTVGMQFQAIKKLNKERVYLTIRDHTVCRYFTVQLTTAFSKSIVLSHTIQNSRHLTKLNHVESSHSCSTWRNCKTVASQGLLKALSITSKMFHPHSSSEGGQVPPAWHQK